VVFPADENLNSLINRVRAPISTTNDSYNEADQVFSATLSVERATNISLASVRDKRTICYINDDDGKQRRAWVNKLLFSLYEIFLFFVSLAFYLGFNQEDLTTDEPTESAEFSLIFSELWLVKGSSVSEQTFRSIITVDPSSTASVSDSKGTNDFGLGTLSTPTLGINYPAMKSMSAPVYITLYTDSIYEGPETIKLCHSPQPNFPQYEIAGNPCAEITLIDSQSKSSVKLSL